MRKANLRPLYLVLLTTFIGCQTTKNLDIQVTSNTQEIKKDIPLSALVEWQQFFIEQETALTPKPASLAKSLQRPDEEEAYNALIIEEYDKAEKIFKAILQKNDSSYQRILLQLATLYLRKGDVSRCLQNLQELKTHLAKTDHNKDLIFPYRYILAISYLKEGDLNQGREILADLIRIDPKFSPAYSALALSYLNLEKFQASEYIVTKGIDNSGENPTLLTLLALTKEALGDDTQAMQILERVTRKSPQYVEGLMALVSLKLKKGESFDLKQKIQKIFSLSSHNAKAYVLLGLIYLREKKIEAAQNSFQQAILKDPQNVYGRLNLAILYLDHLQKPREAQRLLSELLQIRETPMNIRDFASSYLADFKS